MTYEQYIRIYNKDDHYRKDALPAPLKAKKIASELSRRYHPNLTTIRNQYLIAQLFGISILSLERFQTLIVNYKMHKYMTLNGEKQYSDKERT
ncbi:hypothetical protein LNP18_06485 [Leuconostoc citreum]|uniref:hypothetical protein n=1 Tax=Leuconostoc citreum TaxID=33964 RepID=UPI00200A9A93|nr:hypothetical protein [Leuconostoc citreum]MCK8605751.1 hypothetical protein [Leuconostoc citreum]